MIPQPYHLIAPHGVTVLILFIKDCTWWNRTKARTKPGARARAAGCSEEGFSAMLSARGFHQWVE